MRDIEERTGRSPRYLREAHMRRYGSVTSAHSEGEGTEAVPLVIEDKKPG